MASYEIDECRGCLQEGGVGGRYKVRTTALFQAMQTLYTTTRKSELVPSVPTFPFPTMYKGQFDVYNEIPKDFTEIAITSHTGSGKTPLYLSLIPDKTPTLVISPRKFLQCQVASYKKDFVLFGRSEYPCIIDPSKRASNAPCNAKLPCTASSDTLCSKRSQNCNTGRCKVFQYNKQKHPFPCPKCEYLQAQQDAARILQSGGVVVCNFGNFWKLLKSAKLVIIDEADLFFREISHATLLKYSTPKKNSGESIDTLLQREVTELQKAIETSPAAQVYSVQNMLYNAQFLKLHSSLCFQYQRKGRGGNKMYVEINPANVKILKDKIFKGKQLIVVSATLGEFDIPQYSYSVFQRRGVFYAPVGKLTSRELKMKPFILNRAAEAIETISSIAEGMFDTRKFVIHAGNLSNHAVKMNNLLGPDRNYIHCEVCGEKVTDLDSEAQLVKCPKCNNKWEIRDDVCTLHTAGKLMTTIDNFTSNDKRYLIVAGADFGADLVFAKVQFLLKFPYSNLDDRMRTLETIMGKDAFNRYYINEAITRDVQISGRVCRGESDFGVTIILDAKQREVHDRYRASYPAWYNEAYNEEVY